MFTSIKTLVVVSHSPVYCHGGQLFAYGPYVKELNLWAELFPQLVLASPMGEGTPPSDSLAISGSNVMLAPQPKVGGNTIAAKAKLILALPCMAASLISQFRRADAIHVRCPGNLGLLGVLLGPLFSRRLVAKYAGQWQSFPGEPISRKLQRRLLSSFWWRGPVTVYGEWPNQPPQIRSFFTSILSEQQVRRAAQAASKERAKGPLRIVFVGRLARSKNVDVILRAVSIVRHRSHGCRLTIVGNGPERDRLERLTDTLSLRDVVEFVGGLPHDQVLDVFERSDVQVLVSECEGWPKATAEAMAFGLIAIGSDRGFFRQMLGEGRGFVVPVGGVAELANCLAELACAPPNELEPMRRRAAEWAQRRSLDGLREAIAEMLSQNWGGDNDPSAPIAPTEAAVAVPRPHSAKHQAMSHGGREVGQDSAA